MKSLITKTSSNRADPLSGLPNVRGGPRSGGENRTAGVRVVPPDDFRCPCAPCHQRDTAPSSHAVLQSGKGLAEFLAPGRPPCPQISLVCEVGRRVVRGPMGPTGRRRFQRPELVRSPSRHGPSDTVLFHCGGPTITRPRPSLSLRDPGWRDLALSDPRRTRFVGK